MEENQVNITLVSVSEVPESTVLNRSALRRMGHEPINVDMNVRVVPDLERGMISLVVSCSYIALLSMVRQRVLTSSVVATFEVGDLKSHIIQRGQEVVVAAKLMETMLGIAVGALRGVVAVRTAGTPLRHRPLPIINLTALMYRLNYGK